MATIEAGAVAPELDIQLPDMAGEPRVMAEALASGPVLVGIYKCSCQASKAMFPFLERLHQRYQGRLSVFGVSQDSPNIARSFARRLDLTFPILIEGPDYPVSNAFSIAATPTVYLIRSDGTVAFTTMGFFKGPVNELGDAVAAELGEAPTPLVTDADAGVPVFVPG